MIINTVSFKDIFMKTVDFMSTANNIVQFITFIIALLTILYVIFMNFTAPIHKLLIPLGISRRLSFKILLACRKNPRNYIRVFCEYAILMSDGKLHKKSWWNKTYHDFIAFFKDTKADEFIYQIDNCTDILSDDISAAIDSYFNYFSSNKIKKKYKLNRTYPISFLINIQFKQGFLTPNFLLTGLLAKYKDNWSRLVKKYISASSKTEKQDNLTSEIYFTFAWLLWGPSYQMKDQDGHFKLCQYAFGDENNSLIVVLNNEDKLVKLWDEIGKNENGILGSLTCKLFRAKNYINYYRDNFNPNNTYFINKVTDECTGFLLEPASYDIVKDYKAKNYYCTAYVWIMFEVISENEKSFCPENTLTFFEHANLADKGNYDFCIEALISKSFAHFDRVFQADENNRKYRFCLAMNQYIENRFRERLTERRNNHRLSEKYRNNMIDQKKYSESNIFSEIDSYFLFTGDQDRIFEVSYEDKESLKYLGEYYTGIYLNAFPDRNERESLDNILECLKNKSKHNKGRNNYHVLLTVKQDEVVAGLICDYLAEADCGVIEFIAVKNELQSEGLGSRIYQKAVDVMRADALDNNSELDYVICEVEKPDPVNADTVYKALSFWSKMGFAKISFDYIQPALDSDKNSAANLNLIAVMVNKEQRNNRGIRRDTLKSFIFNYVRYAMRIENPQKHPDVIRMLKELDRMDSDIVKFSKIMD